jgi:hypothetical protein
MVPEDSDADRSDLESVQERAIDRQHERTSIVKNVLGNATDVLEDAKYPIRTEELAAEYGDELLDLPNETESLGSVFDRLVTERFESPDEVREALFHELTGPQGIEDAEYNEQRDLDTFDDDRPS